MARIKKTKEYAIKLVHPIVGEYYFNYNNTYWYHNHGSSFMFTQTLSKVSKWKTLGIVEELIFQMIEDLKRKKGKILIPISDELYKKLDEKSKIDIIYNRKKYYYCINNIISKYHLDNAKNKIKKLDKTLLEDSEIITDMIKNSHHLEKEFMTKLRQFENDINSYRKDHYLIKESINPPDAYLDIVDASYGFRYIKLKTLKELNIKNN